MIRAVKADRLDLLRDLLDAGEPVNAALPVFGWTPLLAACRRGRADMIEALCAAGADVNKACSNGTTPLMEACLLVDPSQVILWWSVQQYFVYNATHFNIA